MDYPFWDVAIGGGMLMAIVAVAHVVVSHFAIGGGLVIAVTETLAVRRDDAGMKDLARRSSLVLILVSTVFGAISGVGIWVVAGLVSPAAISALIRNYVWGWAIEWTFFVVEIAAALLYYATWDRISARAHLILIWIYFAAAWLSLVVINGIITFMLTPGEWLKTGAFWDGFFNPTYWPSLVLRTGIALVMATAFMLFPATRLAATVRPRAVRYLGIWLVGGVLVSYAGYRWWEAALPEGVRGLFLGGSPVLATLADTRQFVLWSLTLLLALGVVLLLALPGRARPATAMIFLLVGAAFFASYERVREGARKPFLIHDFMFSNGLRVADIDEVNTSGLLARSGWAARAPAGDTVAIGERVFRAECASCHTINGYQGIRELLPDDPDMILGVLFVMQEQGAAYADAEPGVPVDKRELDYPFMPPFVGTEEEMTALADYLATLTSDEPAAAVAEGGAR